MTNTTPSRTDVYARVTDCIIADREAGVRPWLMPWKAGSPKGRIAVPRRHNGAPYRGINILLLWGAAMAKGYSSPLWMTAERNFVPRTLANRAPPTAQNLGLAPDCDTDGEARA